MEAMEMGGGKGMEGSCQSRVEVGNNNNTTTRKKQPARGMHAQGRAPFDTTLLMFTRSGLSCFPSYCAPSPPSPFTFTPHRCRTLGATT